MMKKFQSNHKRLIRHPEKAHGPAQDGTHSGQPAGKARIEYCYWPYRWLRIPSILLIGVGLLGIISCYIESVRQALSFLNMPSEIGCYVIVLGACILFGFSLICKHRQTNMIVESSSAAVGREQWRSI